MKTAIGLLAAVTMASTACGGSAATGSDSSGTAQTPATAPDAGTDQPTPEDDGPSIGGLPPGGTGTITIDGETIDSPWVGNCQIDEQFDPSPGDLDISAGLGDGIEALFLEINQRETVGVPPDAAYDYLQFRPELQLRGETGSYESFDAGPFVTGPDGTWYLDDIGNVPMLLASELEHDGVPLDVAPVDIDGDQVSGRVTFAGADGPVEVSYDLTITEPVDCSTR